MYHLQYAITRRTPVNQRTLKWILDAQTHVNGAVPWPHGGLNLTPVAGGIERSSLPFPFVRVAPWRIGPYAVPEPMNETRSSSDPDAVASGYIKVRSLWQAHVVAQFLRQISEQFPNLELMLRDDSGGFVLPLGVRIQNGRFEIDRVLLNRERERVLELSGDPQAAAPFLWAEAQALHGELLADVPAHEDPEASELEQFGLDWEGLRGRTIGEAASHVVQRLLSERVSVAS